MSVSPLLEDRGPVLGNEVSLPVRIFRDPEICVLLLLPLAILAINSHWIFSGPFRDPWIYYGFFQEAPSYVSALQDTYYSTRLSVILPGYLAHRLLSPIAANVALHLSLYWMAVLSVYFTARLTLGRRPALLAAAALGGYPFFLSSAGWNYVDGFGIAYFALALLMSTLAARFRPWPLYLVLAGAAVTALLTANLFYTVYLPFLAAHFLFVNRQLGRRPLLRSTLFAGAGAAGLFVLFGLVNHAFGGRFLYILSSLHWSVKLGNQANPFHHPLSTWVHTATWLAMPAVLLLASLALLERVRQMPDGPARRFALAWQLQYIGFTALMLLLQFGTDLTPLEYYFYASLLIPLAFLALGGQLSWFVDGLGSRAYAALVSFAVLAQLVPPALAWAERTPELMRFPVLLPLVAGMGAAGILWLGTRGLRAGLAFLLCLGLSQTLVSNVSPIFRRFDAFDGQAGGVFLQIHRGFDAIRKNDPSRRTRLWYALSEKNGSLYDSVACALVLCPRLVNYEFPELPSAKNCDGTPIEPGQRIAVLWSEPDAVARATASLERVGLSARPLGRQVIPGPADAFTITYIEVVPRKP